MKTLFRNLAVVAIVAVTQISFSQFAQAGVAIETRSDPKNAPSQQLWIVSTEKTVVTVQVTIKPWNYPKATYTSTYDVPPGKSMVGWKHPFDQVSISILKN